MRQVIPGDKRPVRPMAYSDDVVRFRRQMGARVLVAMRILAFLHGHALMVRSSQPE